MTSNATVPFEPRHVHTALACIAALLFIHHPPADAQQTGATDAPPLVVFPEDESRADRPPLSASAAVVLGSIQSDPTASDIRIGHSNPDAVLAARALSLALPSVPNTCTDSGQGEIDFTDVEVTYNEEDLVSVYARDDTADSEISLVIQGPDVLGSIRCGGDIYKIHPLGEGTTAVYEFDASLLREHPPDWAESIQDSWTELMHEENQGAHGQVPDATARDSPGAPGATGDSGDQIDVLVAYTPGARMEAGNIDAFIQTAINNANRIYANSNIALRLRVVDKYEVAYTQHTDMRVDLDRLTYLRTTVFTDSGRRPDPQGYMDEIHDRRDRSGADLVALFVRRTSNYCGYAWIPRYERYPAYDWSRRGFSVTAHSCEALGTYTFTHEIGHNQSADHNPPHALMPPAFRYGHGLCNTAGNWRTVMSYADNGEDNGEVPCRTKTPYFSSPIVLHQGRPTGDATTHDNRRVLTETAMRVANFRQAIAQPTTTHVLPLLAPASDPVNLGFVRLINRSNRAGTVNIVAFDDTGRRFGPVDYSFNALQTRYFNSRDLENGSDRRLPRGVGNGTGNWRLELTADVDIEPLGYSRSPDGFLTGMNALAVETQQGSTWHYRVPFFQEQSIDGHRSRLRLINPGERTASVTIAGVDDIGVPGDTSIRLTIRARVAVMLTTEQLERGDGRFSGRLGDGGGRWQLTVSSDARLHVMSLVRSRSGHLTNVSRGLTGAAGTSPPPPPPPPPQLWGAIATGWSGLSCRSGWFFYSRRNGFDRNAVSSAALSDCRRAGRSGCGVRVTFQQCGALAFGGTSAGCAVYGGSGTAGPVAEQNALSQCRARYGNCRLARRISDNSKITICNRGFAATASAEGQSDSHGAVSPVGDGASD